MKETRVAVVTGGAGFIANTLIERLLSEGVTIAAIDNLSRGSPKHLQRFAETGKVHLIRADLARREECAAAFAQAASLGSIFEVWHLAANSDIPAGVADADVDLKDTLMTTVEVLRAMKAHDIGALHFASSSAIYGDLGDAELHEAIGPLLPISNYGAMKLGSEAAISAAAESHLSRANVFRFPNVVGVPATHGVILDFFAKLRATPHELQVLGDGSQQKAYLHVWDLVDAMFSLRNAAPAGKVEIVNIGPVDAGVTVRFIAEQIVAQASPGARIVFGQGNKGWVGDVPRFRYSTAKLQSHGWRPTLDSAQAIRRAIAEIALQERGHA